jgi:5-methyltetrahydrofolate--homocysteine methyltransferase
MPKSDSLNYNIRISLESFRYKNLMGFFMSSEPTRACVYDPLTEFMAHYSSVASESRPVRGERETMSVEERLAARIVDGDRIGLEADLGEALKTHDALEIINSILLDGMKTVGELFGAGQMQLPFVLQSAETMKAAVAWLEPLMERSADTTLGTIVLATVKGDVHDIGKNLVDIILTNNGYRVVNLGIKVPVETMLAAVEEHHADALGMSGLLVKSTLIMKENLELMRHRGINLPVVLGGAALTRRFVEEDLRPLYGGVLHYARDAFDGLHFMESLASGAASVPAEAATDDEPAVQPNREGDITEAPGGASMESALHLREVQEQRAGRHPVIAATKTGHPAYTVRSAVAPDAAIPTAPFHGSKVVTDIAVEKIYEYINEAALFRGQWQFRRGTRSAEEQEREMREVIRPRFEELKLRLKRDGVLRPAVVYGYFPCASDGDELVVFRPAGLRDEDLYGVWPEKSNEIDSLIEWQRFSFPRQSGDRYLCIADFFRPMDDGVADVCAFHLVTMGAYASEYTAALFRDDKYQEYLYVHGMTVECAEALAEYWHRSIRIELGIAGNDAPDMRKLFSQGYQGSRYSFGYPACPNLEDHRQLFALLQPERIGVALTEEYQLVPEQSTSAIIVHHPQAKYFNVKG